MDQFIDALLLGAGYNAALVCIGAAILGSSAGAAGTFLVLRKRALACKAAASAMLPGIALAFIIMSLLGGDGRNIFGLMAGAAITAWLGVAAIEWIARNTRLQEDAAIGAVLSVSFGAGIVLLTVIQSAGLGRPAGLENLLLGSIAGMLYRDAIIAAVGGVLIFAITFLQRRQMALVAFDAEYAAVCGYNVRRIDLTILTLGVAITVVGLKIVGLILVIALLIIPSVAARYWTNRPDHILLLASLIGATAAYVGAAISASAPGLPAGAVIVLVAAAFFVFSMLFAPERGILAFMHGSWESRKHTLAREAMLALMRGERIESNPARLILHTGGVITYDQIVTDFGSKVIARYALDERRWQVGEALNPDINVARHNYTYAPVEKVFTKDQIVRIDRALRKMNCRGSGKKANLEINTCSSWPGIHEAIQNVRILGHSHVLIIALLRWSFDYCQGLVSQLVESVQKITGSIQPTASNAEIVPSLQVLRNGFGAVLLPTVLTGLTTFGLLSLITPRYSAEALIEVAGRQADAVAIAVDDKPQPPDREAIEAHVNAIMAPDLLLEVATALKLNEKEEFSSSPDLLTLILSLGNTTPPVPLSAATASNQQTLKTILNRLQVFASQKNRFISIQFSSQDQQLAAEFVHRLISSYSQRLGDFPVDAAQLEINQSEKEPQTGNSTLERIAMLNGKLVEAENERSIALTKWQTVKTANNITINEVLPELQNLPYIQQLIEQRIYAERALLEARALLLPAHPMLRQLNLNLKRLKEMVAREITGIARGLKKQFNDADRRVQDIRSKISMLELKAAAASGSEKGVESLQNSAQSRRVQMDRLQRELNGNKKLVDTHALPLEIRVALPVRVGNDPVFPQRMPYALSASFVAFVISLAIMVSIQIIAVYRTRNQNNTQ